MHVRVSCVHESTLHGAASGTGADAGADAMGRLPAASPGPLLDLATPRPRALACVHAQVLDAANAAYAFLQGQDLDFDQRKVSRHSQS